MVNAGGYFFTKTFRKRYRNSEKILYLSKFFVENSNKCLKVQFTGCESDAVVYISNGCAGGARGVPVIGHFEALSRAKQFLGIITIKDRKDGFNYTTFKNQLKKAEE